MKTKHSILASIMMITIIVTSSCSNNKNRQESKIDTPEEVKQTEETVSDLADVSFVDGMTGKVFQDYLHLQRALFNSDLDEAKRVAENLADSFTAERKSLKDLSVKMKESSDIVQVRTYFAAFTEEIEPLFKDALSKGTIYKQHCPMALDNQGANWFADVPEINNPYYGAQMAKCGKTVATISK